MATSHHPWMALILSFVLPMAVDCFDSSNTIGQDSKKIPRSLRSLRSHMGLRSRSIAYGTEVSIRGPSSFLWPDRDFIVQIHYANEEKKVQSMCTGLIKGRYVLTAAHCFYNRLDDEMKHVTVIAGDGSEHKVANVQLIEGYKGVDPSLYASSADMAVLTMDGIGYTPKVKVSFRTEPITKPTVVYLAGFGMTENGGGPDRHRPLVEGKFAAGDGNCAVNTRTGLPSPTVGCAHSFDNPTASCIGDSGGPWFVKEQDGSYSVFGVNMGSDASGTMVNIRASADFTMLSETQNFWKPFLGAAVPASPTSPVAKHPSSTATKPGISRKLSS